ncbi:MAG: hypothetical protein QXW23_04315 [Thermofilaceae archaeon]
MERASEIIAATLAACGAALAAYSYWVLGSVPLVALGIGALIVAASIAATYKEAPYSEAARALLEAYAVNVARVLEEFGASLKATYIKGGFVLAPLTNPSPDINGARLEHLISGSRGRYGLVLKAPRLEVEPGDPEAALTRVLVDTLGLCDNVRVVRTGDRVLVEIVKPREPVEARRFSEVLGPLSAHLAAAALAEALGGALQLEEIEREGKSIRVSLRVVEGVGEG